MKMTVEQREGGGWSVMCGQIEVAAFAARADAQREVNRREADIRQRAADARALVESGKRWWAETPEEIAAILGADADGDPEGILR